MKRQILFLFDPCPQISIACCADRFRISLKRVDGVTAPNTKWRFIMATYIQPSSDARATAIAVAWAMADRTTVSDGANDTEQEARVLAGFVAALSRIILTETNPKGLEFNSPAMIAAPPAKQSL
jgi:hypothetical protein